MAARRVLQELDEDPEFVLLWLSENVPMEYKEIPDMARGMEAVARADLFLQRARRTQNYRLWAYASDLMTAGVATAKDREYRFYNQYRFPLWLSTMGRTRAMRQTKASLSRKLRRHCHTSDSVARDDLIPFYRQMFDLSGAFAVGQTARLEFTEAELAMLLGDTRDGKRVQMLLDAVEERKTSGHIDPDGMGLAMFSRDGDGEELEVPEDEDGDQREADGQDEAEDGEGQKSLLEF
jgi:replication factor C large subunit